TSANRSGLGSRSNGVDVAVASAAYTENSNSARNRRIAARSFSATTTGIRSTAPIEVRSVRRLNASGVDGPTTIASHPNSAALRTTDPKLEGSRNALQTTMRFAV